MALSTETKVTVQYGYGYYESVIPKKNEIESGSFSLWLFHLLQNLIVETSHCLIIFTSSTAAGSRVQPTPWPTTACIRLRSANVPNLSVAKLWLLADKTSSSESLNTSSLHQQAISATKVWFDQRRCFQVGIGDTMSQSIQGALGLS